MRKRLLLGIAMMTSACFAVLDFPFDPTPIAEKVESGQAEASIADIHPAEFEVLDVPLILAPRGQKKEVSVSITRGASFSGAVALSVEGLPPWLSLVSASAVAEGQNTGSFVLNVADQGTFFLEAKMTLVASNGAVVRRKELTARLTGIPGLVDTTFGSDGSGMVLLSVPEGAVRVDTWQSAGAFVAIDANGIVAAGQEQYFDESVSKYLNHGVVVRFDADGRATPGPGDAGAVRFSGRGTWAHEEETQSLLIAGTDMIYTGDAGAQYRLPPTLARVPSTGKATVYSAADPGWESRNGYLGGVFFSTFLEGAVLGTGESCTSGCDKETTSKWETRLLALAPDGGRILPFGTAGIAKPWTAGEFGVFAILREPDGKARLFGNAGGEIATTVIDEHGAASPLTKLGVNGSGGCAMRDPDGTVVLTNTSRIWRLRSDGTIDPTSVPSDGAEGNGAPEAGRCAIVRGVDGSHYVTVSRNIGHFLADGRWDSKFGVDGFTPSRLGPSGVYWTALAIEPQGRLIATGAFGSPIEATAIGPLRGRLVVARYWP